jgi:hypothetical protein
MKSTKSLEKEKCPACGGHMKAQRRWRISIMDMLGTLIVSLFLIAALYFVLQGDMKLLLTKGGFVLIGVLIFLMWVVSRYFIRVQSVTKRHCDHCGFDERNK